MSEVQTARPTVEQVAHELKSMRGYDGMKYHKLVDKQHILSLEAVIADATRRDLLDDLPAVAWALIGCVLTNQPGLIPEQSRFFVATELNVEGISDEYEVRKSMIINSWGRENRYYRNAELAAYQDVAVVLLQLKGSPCAADAAAARAEARQKMLQALRDSAFATMVTSLLKELALADSPEDIEEVSRRVLAELDGAVAALHQIGIGPDESGRALPTLARVLNRVFKSEYWHLARRYTEGSMHDINLSLLLGVLGYDGEFAKAAELRDDPTWLVGVDLLGRVIALIDRSDRWLEVLRPEGLHQPAAST